MQILLSPPLAFLIYIPLVLLILLIGRLLAGRSTASAFKRSVYGSGEEAPIYTAAPGYRPFFLIAFFFAILHLGMLVLGVSGFSPRSIPYLLGLALALIALLLG